MSHAVRVFVVDDHEPFRAAAALVIDAAPDFELVGTAATAEEAVEAIGASKADLVLMDVDLGDGNGIDVTRAVRAARPDTVVVLVSTLAEEDLPAAAWTCGALAYLPKVEVGPAALVRVWSERLS